MIMNSLKLTPLVLRGGAGIYEAGDPDKCYVKLFITETGRVIPITGRVLTEDDLLEAYEWGRLDACADDSEPERE